MRALGVPGMYTVYRNYTYSFIIYHESFLEAKHQSANTVSLHWMGVSLRHLERGVIAELLPVGAPLEFFSQKARELQGTGEPLVIGADWVPKTTGMYGN